MEVGSGTAVGVAALTCRVNESAFAAEPHDQVQVPAVTSRQRGEARKVAVDG